MKITGIQKRVNNGNLDEIMKLWDDFFSGGYFAQLGNTLPIIAVYGNYSSTDPKLADFDLLIGVEVKGKEGFVTIEIPQTTYKKYSTQGVGGPELVRTLWKEIWEDTTIERLCEVDYEIYSGQPENMNLDIFIGIK